MPPKTKARTTVRAVTTEHVGGRHVALLRGINVGGNNILPMGLLAELFTRAGGRDVETYIQSGNVIFRAPEESLDALASRVEASILRRCGFESPVVIRSAAEMSAVARENPFVSAPTGVDNTKKLYVGFLRSLPSTKAVEALDPNRSPGDDFVVRGRDVFLRFKSGAGGTKLTNAWFDARLATTITLRNWNTVQKLAQLAAR